MVKSMLRVLSLWNFARIVLDPVYSRSSRCHPPFFGHGGGPVAMQYPGVEVLRFRQMSHPGEERLPERPSSAYFAKTL
jgi:hypothetical protein